MNPLLLSTATLAVATIYVLWQNYHLILQKRERLLRSRIAYMLWCAANQNG